MVYIFFSYNHNFEQNHCVNYYPKQKFRFHNYTSISILYVCRLYQHNLQPLNFHNYFPTHSFLSSFFFSSIGFPSSSKNGTNSTIGFPSLSTSLPSLSIYINVLPSSPYLIKRPFSSIKFPSRSINLFCLSINLSFSSQREYFFKNLYSKKSSLKSLPNPVVNFQNPSPAKFTTTFPT